MKLGVGEGKVISDIFVFPFQRLVIDIWLMNQIKLGSFAHFFGKTIIFYPNYFFSTTS